MAADEILAIQSHSAPGRNQRGCFDAIVVGENQKGAQPEATAERKPVQIRVRRPHSEVRSNVCSLFLKVSGVAKKVSTRKQVKFSEERCRDIEANPTYSDVRVIAHPGEGTVEALRLLAGS